MIIQRFLKHCLLFRCLHTLIYQLFTNVIEKCKVDCIWTHYIVLTVGMLYTTKVNQRNFNCLRAFENLLYHFLDNSVKLMVWKWFYWEVIVWVIFKVWLLIISYSVRIRLTHLLVLIQLHFIRQRAEITLIEKFIFLTLNCWCKRNHTFTVRNYCKTTHNRTRFNYCIRFYLHIFVN